MTTNYRDRLPGTSRDKGTVSSSSSSGEDSHVVLSVLSSSSSEYLVKCFLGEGTFGKVAKCVKASTGETVAVKMIRKGSFTTEAQNEVDTLLQLKAYDSDRFNFVRCNDTFVDGEHVCLEFEMLDVTLLDFLQRKPSRSLSLKEIRPILHQVAMTLQFLNSLGVVHADLKPDNIMMVDHVNQPLKIKVIDFGLACRISQSQWDSYMQPRFYRSPEVILGFPYTAAIDMWSLGCIAAELFLGYVLYPGCCEYEMLQHMVQTQGQLPHKLLNNGVKTKCFFKRKRCRERRWRLKTPFEFGQATWTESHFNSLDDLIKVRPASYLSEEDNMAEIEDRENFVDLLSRMLHLEVSKRITPSMLLEDPFITIGDLTDSYPNSFYVKSCCEMMVVCQDNKDPEVHPVQQSWLDSQASTSTFSEVQQDVPQPVPPVWPSLQEHPLIVEITSAVSRRLSFQEDQGTLEPQLFGLFANENKKKQREQRLSIDSELTQSLTELPINSSEAPTESTSSLVNPAKLHGKRTWDTFMASHNWNRSPAMTSPKRKRRKMSLFFQNSKNTPSVKAKARLLRKRTWDTFLASHLDSRLHSSSPEKKRRKMNLDETQTQTKTQSERREEIIEKVKSG